MQTKSDIRWQDGLKVLFHFGIRSSEFGFARPCLSARAFGSDWAQLGAGTCGRRNLRFRAPLIRERHFIPLRLDDAPVTGSLAQFLYINWRPTRNQTGAVQSQN